MSDDQANQQSEEHGHEHQSPYDSPATRRGTYALLLLVYGVVVGSVVAIARKRRVELPVRLQPIDLAYTTLATQRLSRLLAKDPVTSPLRAPFTVHEGVGGPAELEERARDDSKLRHTLGELLTCPFCLSQWIATAFVSGQVLAPRFTRLVTATFAAVGGADFLQYAEAKLQQAQ